MDSERKMFTCDPGELEEGDVFLKCSGDCNLRSWKGFSALMGFPGLSSQDIEGFPLVDIVVAVHDSQVHKEFGKIEEMEFDRADFTFKKLMKAIREEKEFCPNEVSLN